MAPITYQLLLDLYRGRSAVVEHLTSDQREALKVATPLARFIEGAALSGRPRHVVLTGNAGDGKSFAALTSQVGAFKVICDASEARPATTSGDPIDALADALRREVTGGARLLLAINRGQLQRLCARLESQGESDDLARIMGAAIGQSELRPRWAEGASADVATVDLGMFETTAPEIINALLDKAVSADLGGLSAASHAAASQALQALRTAHVRRWVLRVLYEVSARGCHVTMRHLWALVGFLVTGGRAADSEAAPTIADSVGARLFGYEGDSAEFDAACSAIDPALRPAPDLCREILAGEASARGVTLPGLSSLCDPATLNDQGRAALRALVVHDPQREAPVPEDYFAQLVRQLNQKGPGWVSDMRTSMRTLLEGIFRALGLHGGGSSFPAWQPLCYDAALTRGDRSITYVERASLRVSALRIAVPRGHPAAAEALRDATRVPFVWFGFERDGHVKGPLRITPRLFRALYNAPAREALDLTPAERMTLQRWLARAPQDEASADGVKVWCSGAVSPLTVRRDDLSNKTIVEWERTDARQ